MSAKTRIYDINLEGKDRGAILRSLGEEIQKGSGKSVPPAEPLSPESRPYYVVAGEGRCRSETCVTCGKPPTDHPGPSGGTIRVFQFKDQISAAEYRIGGMCQDCQDEMFSSLEEHEYEGEHDEDEDSEDETEATYIIRDTGDKIVTHGVPMKEVMESLAKESGRPPFKVTAFSNPQELYNTLKREEEEADKHIQDWQRELDVGDYAAYNFAYADNTTITIYFEISKSKHPEDQEHMDKIWPTKVWGVGYSIYCREGELGSTHRSHFRKKLSKDEFEDALLSGWPLIPNL